MSTKTRVINVETLNEVLAEVREMQPVTAMDVATGISVCEDTVRRALRQLEADGLVESDDYQQRSRVWMTP